MKLEIVNRGSWLIGKKHAKNAFLSISILRVRVRARVSFVRVRASFLRVRARARSKEFANSLYIFDGLWKSPEKNDFFINLLSLLLQFIII